MIIDAYSFTDKGGRDHNEDAAGYSVSGDNGIFVVADGLGGHSFGELASSCVKEIILQGWNPGVQDRARWLGEQISISNSRILSLQSNKQTVLKSTVITLAIDGQQAVWAHTGDSRLYYIHNGWIQYVTADHSVAFKKYKAGEISREELATDEDQSRLLRSLGGKDHFTPDIFICDIPLEPGDGFLLCSDGAWEYLKDGEIPIDMLKAENSKQWAELLLLRMMDRISWNNDNLTLLTIMMK